MKISLPRLRTWFALMAIATVVIVAGLYLFGLYRRYTAVKKIPEKLGLEIQQSTSDFTLSKSEGGRTIFTVKASKAVQYKQGGHAILKGVSIIVYGKDSSRYDQITGNDFEYDPSTGTIQAKGVVRIDLEGNADGASLPDQAIPRELKDPIHLETSGLIFNQKTGIAHTDDVVEIQIPQATGRARGATYDSKANLFTLENDVVLNTSGPRPTELRAGRGEISKTPRQMRLNAVRIVQAENTAEANMVTVNLKPDNTAERIDAYGDVRLVATGPNAVDVRAPRGEILLSGKNTIGSAVFSGGVNILSQSALNGTAGKLALTFGGKNQLTAATASDNVHMHQPATGKQQAVELVAPSVDFTVVNGNVLRQAKTNGSAAITLTPANAASGEHTVITARQFRAQFDDNNKISVIYGEPNARIVSSTPGQQDRTSTSQSLTAEFAKSGGLYSVVQEGKFEYFEPAAGNVGERHAYADRAVLTVDDDTLTLSGSPRVISEGTTVTAQSMRINRRTGDAFAQGSVKTTYSSLRQEPGGAMLAKSEPVHVTARNMNAQRGSKIARYTGGARIWQGANIVEAPTLEFNQAQRTVTAEGTNQQPVKTVFLQVDKDKKATPVTVTALRLNYIDAERRARYTGGVVARGQDLTLNADHADVFLRPATGGAADAPSQLQQIVAEQRVVIASQDRRGVGEKLVYTAQDGSFVLTGGPPTITDPERGTIRGDSLTFYTHDDRVIVESAGSSRTITHTRIGKR